MSEVWGFSGAPVSTAGEQGLTTLVEGSSFCISSPPGTSSGPPMGLFVRDTRVVSEWVLEVDGERLEPLTVAVPDPFRATFVTRARPRPGQAESTLLVVRERSSATGCARADRAQPRPETAG